MMATPFEARKILKKLVNLSKQGAAAPRLENFHGDFKTRPLACATLRLERA